MASTEYIAVSQYLREHNSGNALFWPVSKIGKLCKKMAGCDFKEEIVRDKQISFKRYQYKKKVIKSVLNDMGEWAEKNRNKREKSNGKQLSITAFFKRTTGEIFN